jgi:hypothetical protein
LSVKIENSIPPASIAAPDNTKLVSAKFSNNQFQSPIGKKLASYLRKNGKQK